MGKVSWLPDFPQGRNLTHWLTDFATRQTRCLFQSILCIKAETCHAWQFWGYLSSKSRPRKDLSKNSWEILHQKWPTHRRGCWENYRSCKSLPEPSWNLREFDGGKCSQWTKKKGFPFKKNPDAQPVDLRSSSCAMKMNGVTVSTVKCPWKAWFHSKIHSAFRCPLILVSSCNFPTWKAYSAA